MGFLRTTIIRRLMKTIIHKNRLINMLEKETKRILEINDIYFKQRNSAYIVIKEKTKQLEDINLKYLNLKGSETMAIMARDELQNKLEGISENLGDADVENEKLRKELKEERKGFNILAETFAKIVKRFCCKEIQEQIMELLRGNKHD